MMSIYAPNYYKHFKCIADRCKHSCCIGWEIDIDNDTYELYKNLDSVQDKIKILENTEIEDAVAHFELAKDDRCPFLNEDNLCKLILTFGEDALCDICNDHPRFRNFCENRIEIGLGLCCEEASRLILSFDEKFDLELIDGEYENDFEEVYYLRKRIINIIEDNELLLNQRIEKILNDFEISLPNFSISKWCDIFLGLERLDNSWTKIIENLKTKEVAKQEIKGNEYKNLLVYFIFRHFIDGEYDGLLKERIAFSILSTMMIFLISTYENIDVFEASRMYSQEIEYCQENIDKLLEILTNKEL